MNLMHPINQYFLKNKDNIIIQQGSILKLRNEQSKQNFQIKIDQNQENINQIQKIKQNKKLINIKCFIVLNQKIYKKKNLFYLRSSTKFDRLVQFANAEPKFNALSIPILLCLFKYLIKYNELGRKNQ
ncbi:hypothetical protein TTHERM_000965470 (macronuclear) [Tetrahymena thermophila SB210]|uniref:Uncharacterized protein n=1 Tax=Tetrahymena thermophila (strain SB210) TaxID=312017 RepID=W7XK25_TETTS|nr:hypothetical protein TTHERM_000965470 [Tetrahymena thermophila SB210]EWS76156.1 hypothetical protein TTHERM_000965470 [Tetrahymena thermophila SB210]|eukprot:XP_012651309.1 hypothetical protein TTHERM_000965470 [Tetrahymena thermophila SB210]